MENHLIVKFQKTDLHICYYFGRVNSHLITKKTPQYLIFMSTYYWRNVIFGVDSVGICVGFGSLSAPYLYPHFEKVGVCWFTSVHPSVSPFLKGMMNFDQT